MIHYVLGTLLIYRYSLYLIAFTEKIEITVCKFCSWTLRYYRISATGSEAYIAAHMTERM